MQPVWLTDTLTPDLDRALGYTLLWGLEGIVLRSVGTQGDRVPHINEAKLRRRLAERDIDAAAVDPGLFEADAEARGAALNDLSLLAEVAAFCKRIGCRIVLVGGMPGNPARAAEILRQAGAVAQRHGLTLAVRNETGGAVRNETGGRSTGAELAALLDAADHPAVQAAWGPAAALQAGEAPDAGFAALGKRIAFVTVRDGRQGMSGWEAKHLGEGAVGWGEVLRALSEQDYAGPLSLDLRDLLVAKEGLREAMALIQMIRQARRR